MSDLNPYRVVIGHFPSKQDYAEWSSDKWMDFLRYIEYHLVKKIDPKTKLEVERYSSTHEIMKDIESRLNVPTDPWLEFIWRTNVFLSEGASTAFYYKRIMTFSRFALTWLKANPARISDDMKTILEAHPDRMAWVLKQYYIKNTPMGEIVQRDITTDGIDKVNLPSIQQKMSTSLIGAVNLLGDLVASVKKSHLAEDMTVKDRINAIPKLVAAVIAMSSKKTSSNHFTQINVHGGARDMEAALLDYVKTKEE